MTLSFPILRFLSFWVRIMSCIKCNENALWQGNIVPAAMARLATIVSTQNMVKSAMARILSDEMGCVHTVMVLHGTQR